MKNIIEKIKENGGSITRKELTHNEYQQVLYQVKKGTVQKLKNGLYYLEDYAWDVYQNINFIIPKGVMCMWSAWEYYDYTVSYPHEVHIAVLGNNGIKLPEYPVIKLYHKNKNMYELGITKEITDNGCEFLIYDRERCVCDAIKYRRQIGIDVSAEILDSYIKDEQNRDYNKLMIYAEKMNCAKFLKNILQYKI